MASIPGAPSFIKPPQPYVPPKPKPVPPGYVRLPSGNVVRKAGGSYMPTVKNVAKTLFGPPKKTAPKPPARPTKVYMGPLKTPPKGTVAPPRPRPGVSPHSGSTPIRATTLPYRPGTKNRVTTLPDKPGTKVSATPISRTTAGVKPPTTRLAPGGGPGANRPTLSPPVGSGKKPTYISKVKTKPDGTAYVPGKKGPASPGDVAPGSMTLGDGQIDPATYAKAATQDYQGAVDAANAAVASDIQQGKWGSKNIQDWMQQISNSDKTYGGYTQAQFAKNIQDMTAENKNAASLFGQSVAPQVTSQGNIGIDTMRQLGQNDTNFNNSMQTVFQQQNADYQARLQAETAGAVSKDRTAVQTALGAQGAAYAKSYMQAVQDNNKQANSAANRQQAWAIAVDRSKQAWTRMGIQEKQFAINTIYKDKNYQLAVGRLTLAEQKAAAAAEAKLQGGGYTRGQLLSLSAKAGKIAKAAFNGTATNVQGIIVTAQDGSQHLVDPSMPNLNKYLKDNNLTPVTDSSGNYKMSKSSVAHHMTYQQALKEMIADGVPLSVAQNSLNQYWTKPGKGQSWEYGPDGKLLPGAGRPAMSYQQRVAAGMEAPGKFGTDLTSNPNIPSGVNSDAFATGVLRGIGAKVTPTNLRFMAAWMKAEGTKAAYNPLAVIDKMPGSTDFNYNNGYPVQNFAKPEDGIVATIQHLVKYTPGIARALKSGNMSIRQLAQMVLQSGWGTSDIMNFV
jgi:hypothetical protein